MKISVHKVKGSDLKPGDLFSSAGEDYWNKSRNPLAIGERVYIRTEAPVPLSQADEIVWRIEVEQ